MKLFILIACWCLFFTIQAVQRPAPTAVDSKSEDYVIYSVVLDEYFAKQQQIKHVMIGDHTTMDFPPILIGMSGLGDSMKEIRETAAKDLLQDYTQENKISVLLEARFSSRLPVALISEARRDRIFDMKGEGEKKTANLDGLRELERLYPNSQGFMSLSRIGFNKDSTQALVYVGNICGGLSAAVSFSFSSRLVTDGRLSFLQPPGFPNTPVVGFALLNTIDFRGNVLLLCCATLIPFIPILLLILIRRNHRNAPSPSFCVVRFTSDSARFVCAAGRIEKTARP